MKNILTFAMLLLCGSPLWSQANPCEGGILGRQAGRTDWGPFDCTTVTLSLERYEMLRLTEEQFERVRSQISEVSQLTQDNLDLRDSLITAQRDYQKDLDHILDQNRALAAKNETLAGEAVQNAEYCEKRLRIAKARKWLTAIGAGMVGAFVGLNL